MKKLLGAFKLCRVCRVPYLGRLRACAIRSIQMSLHTLHNTEYGLFEIVWTTWQWDVLVQVLAIQLDRLAKRCEVVSTWFCPPPVKSVGTTNV
jgi:hypothetical protein